MTIETRSGIYLPKQEQVSLQRLEQRDIFLNRYNQITGELFQNYPTRTSLDRNEFEANVSRDLFAKAVDWGNIREEEMWMIVDKLWGKSYPGGIPEEDRHRVLRIGLSGYYFDFGHRGDNCRFMSDMNSPATYYRYQIRPYDYNAPIRGEDGVQKIRNFLGQGVDMLDYDSARWHSNYGINYDFSSPENIKRDNDLMNASLSALEIIVTNYPMKRIYDSS